MIQNQKQTQQSVLNMASSDSQIDKLQRGRPNRPELPDVNINTGAQSILMLKHRDLSLFEVGERSHSMSLSLFISHPR